MCHPLPAPFLSKCVSPVEPSPIFCFYSFLQPSFLQKAGLSPPQGPDGMFFFCICITISFHSYFISYFLLLVITVLFLWFSAGAAVYFLFHGLGIAL